MRSDTLPGWILPELSSFSAAGGFCTIALLAFSRPERSAEPDAGRPAMESGKRTERHASDIDPARALNRAFAEISNLRNLSAALELEQ